MQPLAVGEKTYQARIRRTALSIYLQQPRILYNSTMEIGKVHEERKCQSQRQSTTPGGIEPTKAGSKKAAIAQTQRSGGSRMIKILKNKMRWSEQKESQPFG